jgi:divalent metal cation (Fe/Co/Zn/Cd) transporter
MADPARLRHLAWWLTSATIAWNMIEATVAVVGGMLARSTALIGFGLDSLIETASGLIIGWRLFTHGADEEANERAERRAVRLIAVTFFAIAAYLCFDALGELLGMREKPAQSTVGLILVAASLVVMPTLAWAKRWVARELDSAALHADAAETQLCFYLSGVVLVGLAANSLLGWWWMDPIAGLAVAALALRVGWTAWASGDLCCEIDGAPTHVCAPTCCPACPAAA